MISAPVSRTSSGESPLTVPCVPTGMKAGVCTRPCGVTNSPRRAAPSVVISRKEKGSVIPRMETSSSAPHHRRHQVLDGRRANLLHDGVKLGPQNVEHAFHTRLAERAEAPDIRSSDTNCGRADAQRLGDVGTPAKPAVDQNRRAPPHRLDDLRQRINGGPTGILAAPAMIRHDDSVDAG